MQTVAVTGATGLLGSTLLVELGRSGLLPVAVTSNIKDKDALVEEIVSLKPNWIVHTAALTNVGECEKNPEEAYAVNASGTSHIVEAAKVVGAPVIYISTASVFSGEKGDYREEDAPQAGNVYNKTKLEGEHAILSYEKGMVLRLNLIGIHPNGSRGKNFMEWLVDSIHANKDLTLFNDQYINALSNWTIAELIGKILTKDVHEKVLHIGTSDKVSKAEFAKLVLEHFKDYKGNVIEASVDSLKDGAVRPKHMWLNTEKAQNLLGHMPTAREEVDVVLSRQMYTKGQPYEDDSI